MMRWASAAIAIMLMAALTVPAAALDGNRYAYIVVHDVTIDLVDTTATVTINYTIDPGIWLLVFLLGKKDLQDKVQYITNFDNAVITENDLEHTVMVVENAAFDYKDGAYWFPVHDFNVVIPSLTVRSPQITRTFQMTPRFPSGVGYFSHMVTNATF